MQNRQLSADEALIALIIAAMESSGNVAPIEAARGSPSRGCYFLMARRKSVSPPR